MATRLYLPSSGTSPLGSLAVDSNWEGSVSTFFRAPCSTSKSDTALTDFAARFLSTGTRQDCWGQWVSPQLQYAYSWATTDNVSMVVRCLEGNVSCDAHLSYVIRIVSADGTVSRGILATYMTSSSEIATSARTRIHDRAMSNIVSEAGDRIVIELGCYGLTPSTSYDVTLRFGDPTGTSDFDLTASLATDLCPWVEFPQTVTFGTPPANLARYNLDTNYSKTEENSLVTAGDIANGSFSTFTRSLIAGSDYAIEAGSTAVSAAEAVTEDQYFAFTVTPDSGYVLNLHSLSFAAARGGTSTRGYAVRSSADSYAANIATADLTVDVPTFEMITLDLSGASYQGLSAITFRIYGYAPTAAETLAFDDIALNGTTEAIGAAAKTPVIDNAYRQRRAA